MKPRKKSHTPARRVGKRKLAEQSQTSLDAWAAAGRLAAAMAHEVNNSLDTMQNCLHLLSGQVRPKAAHSYELLRSEAARLTRLVREILGLYRSPQSTVPADLNAVVTQTLRTLQPRLRAGKIQVATALGKVPRTAVSPAQLRMVVSNLVVNAVDAMPGGGKLRVETRAAGKQHVRLRVTDTGMGIPLEMKSRMFQPFVTSKGERGTGLGLWIVSQIVSHHKGSIRALPRKGGGTVFDVELPAAQEHPKGAGTSRHKIQSRNQSSPQKSGRPKRTPWV
ncbi:MAG: sensor histidine kinase [Terriglobales bacterium]